MRSRGMFHFTLLWLGQLFSIMTTSMTSFAITLWIYQKTGSALDLGFTQFFFLAPFLLLSPVAGVMIDRYSRKTMMMVSDLCAGIATVTILILHSSGNLELWHIYVSMVLQGMGNTFQWPAYSAAVSTMVDKKQLGRVNGMMSLMESGPQVLGPIMAAALLPFVGLTGILVADIVTFTGALLILLFVKIPRHAVQHTHISFWKDALFGFRYIFSKPSLLGLQTIFFAGNFCYGIAAALFAPMILARTANNSVVLGSVQSSSAIAAVAGGIAMTVWGGFKKRIHGVLLGWFLSCFFGVALFGLGQSITFWIITAMTASFFSPLINGSNQAIWQAKVAYEVQGRVFSARRLIAWLASPLTPVIAGVLADKYFEPSMQSDTLMRTVFSPVFGNGSGAGMGIIIFIFGLGAAVAGLSGYIIPAIHNVENLLPDHDVNLLQSCGK